MRFFDLFDSSGFVPRRLCGEWTDTLLWTHIISDGLIWLCYLAIPVILIWFVRRRRDTPFPGLFWLFGAFIVLCGLTHFFEMFMFFHPLYRLSGLLKAITALVSLATVIAIIRVLPVALRLRTPAEVDREVAARTIELGRVNVALQEEITQRLRMDRLLHQEREQFRLTLNSISEGVIAIDKQGRIASWNPAAERLYGWSHQEVFGKPFSILFPPDSPRELGKILEALRRGDGVKHFETVRIAKNGDRTNVDVVLSPIRDPDGALAGTSVIVRDVTINKKTQEAIQHSEEQYRFLAESIPQMVWTANADGSITYVNQKAADYVGMAKSETPKWEWQEIIHPTDFSRSIEKWNQSIRKGFPHEDECRLKKVDASYRWHVVRGLPFKDVLGRVSKWVGTCTDIDEQKRAEVRFRRLVEHAADGFILNNLAGQIIDVNQKSCESLGYSRDELLAMSVWDISRDADQSKHVEMWRNIEAGQSLTIEEIHYRRDGATFPVEARITLFEGDSGILILNLVRDLTERKRLESQFHQSQKMEAVGHLAAGVAHDFNNLLTVIHGYGSIALKNVSAQDPTYECVNEIIRASDRAASLTRQLLAFSRKAVVAPKLLDLNEVVLEMKKLLHRLIGEDVELITGLEPKLGIVKIDPGQVEQVILNLVVNARDAMPNGGKITITTTNDRQVNENRVERKVVLSVSDTGSGMTADVLSHLFEPFFTTKEKGKGSGLGLATVQGIIKQANGSIQVESVMGEGTTFKIYLPQSENAGSSGKSIVSFKAAHQSKKTILLVEDEDEVRGLIQLILQGQGNVVLSTKNGAEAVRKAQEYKETIDLLVTDVVMPGMGGRVLAERIAQLRPSIPVLYLSGYTDDAIVRHGIMEEQVNFLHKPFSPEELLQKLTEIFTLNF